MSEQSRVVNVTVVNNSNGAAGIASFIFGLISIFILAPIFAPLAIITGVIGLIKKQIAWSVLGLVCAIIGVMTSPILLGILGLATIASAS